MMRRTALVLAFSAALATAAAGCSDPFRDAAERDTAEAWRAYLATDAGDEAERSHARSRLEDLLWEEAKSLDSIASYGRYLESFPRGRHVESAVARLEALRFERAMADGDPRAFEDFLARHPRGRHAPQARARLAAWHREAALEAETVEALEAFLARFAGAEGTDEVEAALARLRFEEAVADGTLVALERLRQRFPEGPHREAAEARARALRVKARILAGDVPGARRIIEGTGAADVRQILEVAAAEATLEVARMRLDLEALRTLARTGPEPVAGRAAEDAAALAERTDQRRLTAAAARLARADPGLPAQVIEAGLADRDARRRWVSVRALGHSADPEAIGPLVAALEDRNLGVRAAAAEALVRLGDSLPREVRDVYFTETLARLEGRAAEPARIWTAAVLLEAAGDDARALKAHRRAAEDPDVVLARLRLAELETEPHRRAVPLTGAALWLRDALETREASLMSLARPAPGAEEATVDPTLLRQTRPLLDLLAHAVALAESDPDAELRFTWLPEVRHLQDEMTALFADAQARARMLDPTWVDPEVDEGAEGRAAAAADRAEAVRVLAEADGALEPVRRILDRARRSPHPAEAEVAAAARGAGEEG